MINHPARVFVNLNLQSVSLDLEKDDSVNKLFFVLRILPGDTNLLEFGESESISYKFQPLKRNPREGTDYECWQVFDIYDSI